MAGMGVYYSESFAPLGFSVADFGAVTPTTTAKSVWPVGAANPTILPANFWYPGRIIRLTANLKLTTGTAGNSTFSMAYGAADNPACIVSTASRAKVASVGPFGVFIQGYAQCRTVGTAGTLSMWGFVAPDLGAFLSTTDNWVFPSNGTTVVSTIDTTVGTNGPNFQYLTSAGTDSIVTTNVLLEILN
jgi:hypothetical protein